MGWADDGGDDEEPLKPKVKHESEYKAQKDQGERVKQESRDAGQRMPVHGPAPVRILSGPSSEQQPIDLDGEDGDGAGS